MLMRSIIMSSFSFIYNIDLYNKILNTMCMCKAPVVKHRSMANHTTLVKWYKLQLLYYSNTPRITIDKMSKVNYLCINPNIDTLWAPWYIQVGSKKFDLQLEVAWQATASAPIISCEDLKSCFIGSKAATTQHLLTTWSFPLCFHDNKK